MVDLKKKSFTNLLVRSDRCSAILGNYAYLRGIKYHIMTLCSHLLVLACFCHSLFAAEVKKHNKFFHDDAKAFHLQPEMALKLEQAVTVFNEKYQFIHPLHVVTTTSTANTKSLVAFAEDKRKEFLNQKEGFILVYEVDYGAFSLSLRPIDEDVSSKDWIPSIIPQYVDREFQNFWQQRFKNYIDRKQVNQLIRRNDPVESCFELAQTFMDTFDEYTADTQIESNSLINASTIKIAIGSLVLLAAFISALVIQARVAAKKKLTQMVFYFPFNETPKMLGASCGAETCSIKFGK